MPDRGKMRNGMQLWGTPYQKRLRTPSAHSYQYQSKATTTHDLKIEDGRLQASFQEEESEDGKAQESRDVHIEGRR
jgi:hypothetical protein